MSYQYKDFAPDLRYYTRKIWRVCRWIPSFAASYKTGLPAHRHKLS